MSAAAVIALLSEVVANLPAALATAATGIATALAVLLIKRQLTSFCASGASVV